MQGLPNTAVSKSMSNTELSKTIKSRKCLPGNRLGEIDNILDILFSLNGIYVSFRDGSKKDSNCDFKIRPVRKEPIVNDTRLFHPKRYKDFMEQAVIEPYRRFPVFDDVKNRMKNDIAYQNSKGSDTAEL